MTSPREAPPGPRRGFRVLRLAALVLLLPLTLVLGTLIILHTSWGMATCINLVLRLANPLKGGQLSVRAARGGFLSGVERYGVHIRRGDGSLEIKADTLTVRYRLAELVQPTLRVRTIAVSGLHVMARLPFESEPAPKQPGS